MEDRKQNYIAFFIGYFCINIIFVAIHSFLPIFLFNVLNVDRVLLSVVLMFSYFAFVVKIIISVYFDKGPVKKKLLIIISTVILLFSFLVLVINVGLLIVFGIMLGVNFAFISLIDASIDKVMVERSDYEELKNMNILIIILAGTLGTVMVNIIWLMTMYDIDSILSWNTFLFVCFIAIIPLVLVGLIIREDPQEKPKQVGKVNRFNIMLICIYLFLVFSDKLFEYPLEPWIVKKYFNNNPALFSAYTLLMLIVVILGYILGFALMKKLKDRKKVLIICTIIIGILLIIAPFQHFGLFLFSISIWNIVGGILIVISGAYMIDLSRGKGTAFQIMSAAIIMARVVFVPLGTLLSVFISTELIIILSGIITLISVTPLLFIRPNQE